MSEQLARFTLSKDRWAEIHLPFDLTGEEWLRLSQVLEAFKPNGYPIEGPPPPLIPVTSTDDEVKEACLAAMREGLSPAEARRKVMEEMHLPKARVPARTTLYAWARKEGIAVPKSGALVPQGNSEWNCRRNGVARISPESCREWQGNIISSGMTPMDKVKKLNPCYNCTHRIPHGAD